MKAAFFKLPGRVEIWDEPNPEPGEGDVLVQVLACGICGTDAEAFRSHQRDWHRRGHEYSGRVVAVGDGVKGLKEGDLVAGIGSLPCGECRSCRSGDERCCDHPRGFGSDAFAEFLCKPASFFFPIPDLRPEEGALMEPLTVAMDLVRDGAVRGGSQVVLIGAGPIGLMTIPIGKAMGAKVTVVHPSQSERRWRQALDWGADFVFHPDREDVVDRILKLLPDGADTVLVTIKPSVGIPLAARLCRVGGTIAFIGMEWRREASLTLDIDRFHFRKLRLVGSNHNPCSLLYPDAAELLKKKVIKADELVSHRFGWNEIDRAFRLSAYEKGCLKVMVGTLWD